MSHETFDTLAAGYALGALDGEDLAQFGEHMAQGCARCKVVLRESQEALAMLAREAPAEIPPASVKQALMARIAAERAHGAIETAPGAPEGARRSRGAPVRWLPWALGTVAATVAAAFFTGMFVASRYEARLGQMVRESIAQREQLRRTEATLRDQLAAASQIAELVRDPATLVLPLRGTGPTPGAVGRVVWHATQGGHLFVANLAPAPPGKTYELWTITGGKPRPAGLFDVDAGGQATRRVDPVDGGRVDVFAVTLEPAGGLPAPTGPIVLASK